MHQVNTKIWTLIIGSFKAIASVVCEKKPCMQNFNKSPKRGIIVSTSDTELWDLS